MRDIEAAYLAGYFDGDGHVGIVKSKKGHYCLQTELSSTDPTIPQWLYRLFGGSLDIRKRGGNFKPQHRWIASSKKSAALLKEVASFVQIKKEQVKIALQFSSGIKRTGKALSQETVLDREQMRLAISKLNQNKGTGCLTKRPGEIGDY